jgi:Uma2 family endonuclease
MRTAALVSVDEYLHSDYRPDREYIDGEVQERNLGEKDHSKVQARLIVMFAESEGLHVWPEQRVQVKATRFRVPDVCVTTGEPDEQIFTAPPYIIVEILSPEDTLARLMERIEDYWAFGVRNIWVIDPHNRPGYRASPDGLVKRNELATEGEPRVVLTVETLFE